MQQSFKNQHIIGKHNRYGIALVLTINPDGAAVAHDCLTGLSGLIRSVGFRGDGDLSCVAGIGSSAWDRLFQGPRPAGLHVLPVYKGDKYASVSTPGDLFFHIRADQMDSCFELAVQIMRQLDGAVEIVDETHGFKYYDQRDLMGFVDGTENPALDEAPDFVFVGDEDKDFVGGSYVIVQKYLHDMKSWDALKVEQQEDAIGRKKLSDVEYAEGTKPANAHTTLTVIHDENGVQQKIQRYNMPFGSAANGANGTYFIGYSKTPALTEQMLENMFCGKPRGAYDRLLDFSTVLTGSLFFTPSADFLDDAPDLPESAAS